MLKLVASLVAVVLPCCGLAQAPAKEQALGDRFDHESALNVFLRSDQFPFVLKNVPAFCGSTGFHPDYHHVTDTAETIDYVKVTKILQLAYWSAGRFAEDTKPPVFVANPKPEVLR